MTSIAIGGAESELLQHTLILDSPSRREVCPPKRTLAALVFYMRVEVVAPRSATALHFPFLFFPASFRHVICRGPSTQSQDPGGPFQVVWIQR